MDSKPLNRLFILGNHIQGLGVSRLAKRNGMEVWLFNDTSINITRFSNTCKRFIKYIDEDDLLKKLLGFRNDTKPVLMPTNDKLVWFIAENYKHLADSFLIPLPKPEIVEIAYNKILTYRFAQENGIPIPGSFFPQNDFDLAEIAERIDYPVVVKPAVMHSFYKATGKKVFKCNNVAELKQAYSRVKELIPPDQVIVQEMIQGGPGNLYSFGSFCDGNKVWASLMANRIRQKPMDFGVSTTYARSVYVAEIEQYATEFLSKMGFFGISEVEFMFDSKTGQYKLLEINPRTWKWHSIANILGVDLLKPMLDYWGSKTVKECHNRKIGIGWIERLTDFYVFLNEFYNRRMSVKEYICSMRIPKESAVFSLSDPIPALMYLLLSPILLIKR